VREASSTQYACSVEHTYQSFRADPLRGREKRQFSIYFLQNSFRLVLVTKMPTLQKVFNLALSFFCVCTFLPFCPKDVPFFGNFTTVSDLTCFLMHRRRRNNLINGDLILIRVIFFKSLYCL